MKSLLLPFALFLSIQFASAQKWVAYTPPFPDTACIVDVHVVDENVMWAVGLPAAVDDTFFYTFSSEVVYAAVTTDGGAHWNVHTVPMGSSPYVANMTAIDGNTAWVAGLDNFGDSKVLKTTDGGASWTNANVPFDPAMSWVNYIHAFSSTEMIAIGDPLPTTDDFEIYKTTDGGQTWDSIPGSNIPDLDNEYGFANVGDVVGQNIWFGTNEGHVFRSTDGGLHWDLFPIPGEYVALLSFSDANNGVIMEQLGFHPYHPGGLFANIYHSSDGGENWEILTPPNGNYAIRITGLEYVPNSSAIVLGISETGVLNGPFQTWVSLNRGASWTQVSTGEHIVWPTFLSNDLGWAGEFQPDDDSTHLYKADMIIGLISPHTLDAEIVLSPNPTSDVLNIKARDLEAGDYWLMINDAQGRLMQKVVLTSTDEIAQQFNLRNLPAGMYTLTLVGSKGATSRQFMKQ